MWKRTVNKHKTYAETSVTSYMAAFDVQIYSLDDIEAVVGKAWTLIDDSKNYRVAIQIFGLEKALLDNKLAESASEIISEVMNSADCVYNETFNKKNLQSVAAGPIIDDSNENQVIGTFIFGKKRGTFDAMDRRYFKNTYLFITQCLAFGRFLRQQNNISEWY